MFYARNENLYKSPYIGIDGLKTSAYGVQQQSHKPRNVQQSPVGIPIAHLGSKGMNWNQQDSPQKNWRGNQRGNQKGDNKPMKQRGIHKQQNWQNKRSVNANTERRNFVKGQNGSRRNNKGQQRGHQNQKGLNLPSSMGVMHESWDQRGGMPNIQMFNQQGGVKGGRQPNARNQSKGSNRRNPNVRRMGRNRNANSDKGFDTNTWSIRAKNFQINSQDRKSSSSEQWPNADPAVDDNYDPQKITGLDNNEGFSNFLNEEHYENKDMHNEWNYAAENANEWEENGQVQWSDSYSDDYDYS